MRLAADSPCTRSGMAAHTEHAEAQHRERRRLNPADTFSSTQRTAASGATPADAATRGGGSSSHTSAQMSTPAAGDPCVCAHAETRPSLPGYARHAHTHTVGTRGCQLPRDREKKKKRDASGAPRVNKRTGRCSTTRHATALPKRCTDSDTALHEAQGTTAHTGLSHTDERTGGGRCDSQPAAHAPLRHCAHTDTQEREQARAFYMRRKSASGLGHGEQRGTPPPLDPKHERRNAVDAALPAPFLLCAQQHGAEVLLPASKLSSGALNSLPSRFRAKRRPASPLSSLLTTESVPAGGIPTDSNTPMGSGKLGSDVPLGGPKLCRSGQLGRHARVKKQARVSESGGCGSSCTTPPVRRPW